MKKSVIYLVAVCILPAILLSASCTGDREMTPEEEASSIIGLPVPLPEYLPEGYEIRSVDVEGDTEHGFWDISVLIHNSEDGNPDSSNVTMNVHWFYPGLKLVDIEKVAIGDSKALVFREPDRVKLLWIDSEGRGIELTGNANLEFDELVKIAESVTTPPRDILDIALEPDYDLRILRGDSQRFTLYLHNNSLEPVKVSLARDDSLPEDIRINIHDDSFTLKSGESRNIAIDVKVGPDTPSPAWHEPADNEDLSEELQGPPHPVSYTHLTLPTN